MSRTAFVQLGRGNVKVQRIAGGRVDGFKDVEVAGEYVIELDPDALGNALSRAIRSAGRSRRLGPFRIRFIGEVRVLADAAGSASSGGLRLELVK